jgi:hypothetical protein
MKDEQNLISSIAREFDLDPQFVSSKEVLLSKLTSHINHLINTDFEKLVYYLYRIDVDEQKIKQLMQQQGGENAAEIIAKLIIDRQLEKIESRRKFKQQDDTINEEDKW